MSVFEQLQPFVSLCQACGFVPYTIKRNSTTGKFERTVGFLNGDLQDILSTDRTIPTTLIILTGISTSLFLAQLLPSRWIALHHRHLTNAVEAIQRVERLLGEEFITEHASSIPIRFVVGFAAVLMMSTGVLVVTMPMYAMLLPPAFGIFSTIVLFVASASINITTDKIELMKRNALTFDYLCRASSELNSVFSIPVFYILAIKFVTVVSTAFGYAYRFIHTNDILDNAFLIYPFLIVTESIRIFILFTSTDMPVNQVRLLHERVSALSLSGFSKTMAEKITMMTLLTQIDEDRVHLSAVGLFKVGVHLIPTLTGAVVTYMVILLQN
ncbi:hypothetical protein OUZ56_001029 [Daphnia magna]|uniref:Gustatory receptor n=1 Tax=Daphnia magna TaxID=35525 RepID=A0ABR0A1G1_9CRUS|nr:hypothetical protein OUZ56_001029 [Daphnia magna]